MEYLDYLCRFLENPMFLKLLTPSSAPIINIFHTRKGRFHLLLCPCLQSRALQFCHFCGMYVGNTSWTWNNSCSPCCLPPCSASIASLNTSRSHILYTHANFNRTMGTGYLEVTIICMTSTVYCPSMVNKSIATLSEIIN